MNNLDQTNKDILKYLSEGLTYKEIGQKIFLSYETVKKRLQAIKEKTGCRNDKALIFYFAEEIKNMKAA